MNKKEKRLERHIKNKRNEETHKKEAWKKGKLIRPNHNEKPFPIEYSKSLGIRLINLFKKYKEESTNNEEFVFKFQAYRKRCIEFILYYDHSYPLTNEYNTIKTLLETYWDNPENLINVPL